MITGDKTFGPGHPRFELQKSAVDELAVVYVGRGSIFRYFDISKYKRFDVVTSQDPFWRGLFAWFVGGRIGAKLNVQVHTDLSAERFLRRLLARAVLRRADSIRVVSEKIKEQVLRVGVRATVTVLPIYINLSKFRTIIPQPRGTQKTILWLGRFEKEKDPLRVVSVFQEVQKSIPDAKLIMLGRGSLESRLRTAVARFNLDAKVEFPGWQDPAPFFAEADVVLCTSVSESYGAGIIEALAAGVPVVAPDVGVAREAGAIISARSNLAEKVIEVLRSGVRGELRLQTLSKQEWAQKWKETL